MSTVRTTTIANQSSVLALLATNLLNTVGSNDRILILAGLSQVAYPESMNLDGHTDYVVDYGETLSEPMDSQSEALEVAGGSTPPLPVYRRTWVALRATDQRTMPGECL